MRPILGQTPQRRPRLKWPRFTLRTLFIGVTITAIWLGFKFNESRRQAVALREITAHGADALYEHQISGTAQPLIPTRVRHFIGEDMFQDVVRLNFKNGFPETDDGFAPLAGLNSVTVINTEGSNVTDSGLEHLRHSSTLTCLRLIDAKVTDEGLMHLQRLKHLDMLDLSGNHITDAGLVHLAALEKLEYLTLQGTSVSNAGILSLAPLKRLRYLNVRNTNVTESGAKEFRQISPTCEVHF
jgi:hypothetical protein